MIDSQKKKKMENCKWIMRIAERQRKRENVASKRWTYCL